VGIWSCRLAARGLLVCLLAAGSAPPCFGQMRRGWKKVWTASVAALAAVNVMDARSSVGRYETNPLLRDGQGRFNTGRAIAVKSAASGGILLVQFLLMRRNPQERLEKPAAIINFAAAATVGAIAYRNTRVVP
jgi:hypothetical protein